MIRQYFLPPTTLLSLHSSDVTEEAVWSYRYSPPSSHASTNSPEILFHHQHSRIIRNIRSTNRARSFRLLVTKQPKTLKGKRIRKNSLKIYSTVYPLSFHIHVHPLPFHVAATIYRSNRVDVSDPEFAFPRKIHGGGGGWGGWLMRRGGWKREKGGRTFLRPSSSFFPPLPAPRLLERRG